MSWSTEQEQQNILPACRVTIEPLYPLVEKQISFFGRVLTIHFQIRWLHFSITEICWNSAVLKSEQLIICYRGKYIWYG